MNFWKEFNREIYALAPMAGFTDQAFRGICSKFGADVVYSEMASVQALHFSPEKTLKLLKFNPKRESKYVVQLFGSNPQYFQSAIKLVEEKIQPDGIDINFGCPVPKVLKQQAGAQLMKDLDLSRRILEASLEVAQVPVSIKVRSKVGDNSILDFLNHIQDLNIPAIMIHGRSLQQGFSGDIDHDIIKQAKYYTSAKILANGGIDTLSKANEVLNKTQADGLGLARGVLGRPWLFQEIKTDHSLDYNHSQIFKVLKRHAKLKYKLKGREGMIELRKHLPYYVNGLSNASSLRKKLVQIEDYRDVKTTLKNYHP